MLLPSDRTLRVWLLLEQFSVRCVCRVYGYIPALELPRGHYLKGTAQGV